MAQVEVKGLRIELAHGKAEMKYTGKRKAQLTPWQQHTGWLFGRLERSASLVPCVPQGWA